MTKIGKELRSYRRTRNQSASPCTLCLKKRHWCCSL